MCVCVYSHMQMIPDVFDVYIKYTAHNYHTYVEVVHLVHLVEGMDLHFLFKTQLPKNKKNW